MKKGWKQVKIGDLGKVITGNTPPKKDPSNYGSEYPFIKPTDMDLGRRYVTNWEENYSEKAFKKYKNSYIPPKATGVVTIGTVGEKMFQADRYCFTNQSVNVVIANDKYDDDFIYYLLKINLPKVENANPGTASGRHHVSKSNFCAIKITVPESKETQRRIASILSAYDELIENNLKRIKLLEEQAQQTYEEWFVRFKFPGYEDVAIDGESGLPVGWERKNLVECANLVMGQRPKSEFYNYEEMGLPFHQGVKDYGFRFPTNSSWSTRGNRIAEEDSILFSVRAPVGRINIAIEKLIIGRGLASINHRKGWNSFLLYQLKSIFYQEDLMGGGAIYNSVTKKDVERIQIVQATEEINSQFNNLSSKIDKQIKNLTLQNQLLKEARDILLPRLMSGMIDVNELSVDIELDMVAEENRKYNKVK
ncbi:restriction endonuclease subunit S [Gelidibacter mesophilus]|uniref:restriction endonuclease subunit S n=1 Tax=Gelidibacter mesophilus TaxID=169050 RepID=UPI00041C31C5|nr:restriction endonuclease subunit S [Gelidibacter mesophilus]